MEEDSLNVIHRYWVGRMLAFTGKKTWRLYSYLFFTGTQFWYIHIHIHKHRTELLLFFRKNSIDRDNAIFTIVNLLYITYDKQGRYDSEPSLIVNSSSFRVFYFPLFSPLVCFFLFCFVDPIFFLLFHM